MMAPLLQALKRSQGVEHSIPMERFYRHVGISRQGFSKKAQRSRHEQCMIQELTGLVHGYRKKKDRRAGSRSLYANLGVKVKFDMGVTKFERLMSANGLSLAPLRTRVVTTRSSMQSWNYKNLINGLTLTGINQVVAGDITYIYHEGRRYYLFCLIDLYSARIVGHHIGPNMRAEDAKQALDQWVRLRKKETLKNCIHHTDGGGQYFSGLYLSELGQLKVRISRAENCLKNGYAEQRNGLIKYHLLPTIQADSESKFSQEISRIIRLYNQERKQEGLGWLSPVGFEKKIAGLCIKPERNLYNFNLDDDGFDEA
ncbi:MAG: IS3 family transposase [Cyclobacteriaceae bacterium]|nr:IS3 family transposase [Cyclobacteriaceae bacterium]